MKRTKRRVLIQRIEQAELEGATDLQTLQGRSLAEILLEVKKDFKGKNPVQVFDKCFWDSKKRKVEHSRFMLDGRRYTQINAFETLVLLTVKELSEAYKDKYNTVDLIIQHGHLEALERARIKAILDTLVDKELLRLKWMKLGHCKIPMFKLM